MPVVKQSPVRFFYSHAGYSYDPKTETRNQGKWRTARELAHAEAEAQRLNLSFNWDYDPDGCIGCDCGQTDCACASSEPHETLYCWVEDEQGNNLASLGGICGADCNYKRVVEAELAQEAIAALQAEGAKVNA